MGTQKSQMDVTADPPVHDPARAEYKPDEAKSPRLRSRRDPNDEERKEDHVYSVASRARWANSDIAELHRDSRALEGLTEAGEQEEEEEEEEESSASGLTVPKLKAALTAANVEIPVGAKKPELVALYEQHNLGDAE